jgi:hypothetical protein
MSEAIDKAAPARAQRLGAAARSPFRPLALALGASALLGAGLGVAGCGDDRPPYYDSAPDIVGPVAAEGRFLYLDRTTSTLLALTPDFGRDGLSLGIERAALGERPTRLWLSPDGTFAFTINGGDQTLSVVEMGSLEVISLELPSDYDALTLDPAGRFVVAHYADASSGGSGDSVFVNQNEITIFDLNPDGDADIDLDEVTSRVLSLRSSPLGFDFAPPFAIDGVTHHLLVVRADSALALVDMTAESEVDLQRRLFFVPEDSPKRVFPARVIFGDDDPADDFDTRFWVLATGAQDIYEVALLPPGPEDETQLAISLNQFPAGPSPTDMLRFYDADGNEKLLVANGTGRELTVVDVATGAALSLDVAWSVSRILPFELVDEESQALEQWALLYTPGANVIAFANLETIEARGTRALSSLALSRPVARFEQLEGGAGDKIVAIHSGGNAISVVDLARRYDIPLPGTATLANTAFSLDGAHLYTTVAEVSVLAMIELANGHPSQLDLSEPGGAIAVLAEPQVILVDHGAAEGRVTLLSGVEPSAEGALTVDGLFLDSIFDRAAEIAAAAE